MTLLLGMLIGVVLYRIYSKVLKEQFLTDNMICVYSLALLYYAEKKNEKKFAECEEKLVSLGVDERLLKDPDGLQTFLTDHIKKMEDCIC